MRRRKNKGIQEDIITVKEVKKSKRQKGETVEKGIRKVKGVAKKATEGARDIGKTYMSQARKSIRHEILNLVLLAALASFVVGILTTGIAINIGMGRYQYTEHRESKIAVQQYLSDTARELNKLDYMDVAYNIEPQAIYELLSEYDSYEGSYDDQEQDEVSQANTDGGQHTVTEHTEVRNTEPNTVTEETTVDNSVSIPNQSVKAQISREEYAILTFQSYLNSNVIGKYNGQQYHYNDEGEEEKISEDVRKLYDQLATMIEQDQWSKEKVYQLVEAYYKLHSSKYIFKEKAVKDILSSLDRMGRYTTDHKNYLLDSAGNVLYQEGIIRTIDIVEAIKNTTTNTSNRESSITSMYPVILNGEVHYLFSQVALEGQTYTDYNDIPNILGWLAGLITFIVLIFKLTTSKVRYIEYLSECLDEIAKGNLDYVVEVKGEDELAKLASDMSRMENKLKKQIEERAQAERTKNELITNVAHDLRTPLTSIIGYMGLVKDGKYENEEECEHYLDIAYSKSERLKVLIEDLFEYTKLSNRVSELKLEQISVALLMNQLIEELRPQAEERNICIKTYVKAEDSAVYVDVMKMARVFENLLGNAIKYSMENECIQVIVQSKNGYVYATVRNRCENMPEGDMTKLFDRFYRTDNSRNSTTGGSGLGLAIAKHIVERHQGKIWAQVDADMISFNVKLKQL